MPGANIFRKAADALRNFNTARRKKSLERLLARSREFEDKLETEAKRFGIDLRRLKTGNYYEVLGIKYTADHKAIKEAYHELMMRHHPDVSKDVGAEELTKKINEAYAVLKDRKLREEYDKNSFRGEVSISADATKCITKELMKKYAEAREKDFKEFRAITSVPLRRDALVAAIEDVCNWSKRFDKAAGATFGNFRNYEKNIKKLGAINKKLLQNETEEATLYKLRENGRRLDELILACGKVEKGISIVTKKVKEDIGSQESVITKKLRALV
jgi:curved DNA-binding protein CbpA